MSDQSIWKPVTYPGIKKDMYEVNSEGQIRIIESKEVIEPFILLDIPQANDKNKNDSREIVIPSKVWMGVKVEYDTLYPTASYIEVPVHMIVAYEFCDTLLDKNKMLRAVRHIDYDTRNYHSNNLAYAPMNFMTCHDECAFNGWILKEDNATKDTIRKETGEIDSFLNRLFYDKTRRRDIKKFFITDKSIPKEINLFTPIQKEAMKYLILLGYKHEDICEAFGKKYLYLTFQWIETIYKETQLGIESGVLPKPGNFEDPRWKYAIEKHSEIADAVEKYKG